jgi:hypothetical protein
MHVLCNIRSDGYRDYICEYIFATDTVKNIRMLLREQCDARECYVSYGLYGESAVFCLKPCGDYTCSER